MPYDSQQSPEAQAKVANAPTLYAGEGFRGATALYADPGRRRWVMVVHRTLAEGELVEGDFHQYHPITWGNG